MGGQGERAVVRGFGKAVRWAIGEADRKDDWRRMKAEGTEGAPVGGEVGMGASGLNSVLRPVLRNGTGYPRVVGRRSLGSAGARRSRGRSVRALVALDAPGGTPLAADGGAAGADVNRDARSRPLICGAFLGVSR